MQPRTTDVERCMAVFVLDERGDLLGEMRERYALVANDFSEEKVNIFSKGHTSFSKSYFIILLFF